MRLRAVLLLLCAVLAAGATDASATSDDGDRVRAMWVWGTDLLLEDERERELFLEEAGVIGLTDVYLFLRATDYAVRERDLQSLLFALDRENIRAWGMEGWRGYFSDAEGPKGLYAALDALIAFNERNDVDFAGFHSDLEPHDGQDEGRARFFNGVPSGALTPRQEATREGLLSEWVSMHANLRSAARRGGILYGAALPSWLDDYYGEAPMATADGHRASLLAHLMPLVSQHVVMSYNTDPKNVIDRIQGELDHGDALGRPRVMFSVEVHPGVGKNVSYADTPGRSSRAMVLSDIAAVEARVKDRPSYLGWSIHDWRGWAQLPP